MTLFSVETEVCLSPLSVVRPHLDLQIHLVCSKKQVILGWGAVWPSVCPLMVTNGSQDQLVVIILFKNMQTSALPMEGLHPSYTKFWVAGGICTFIV